VKYIDWDELKNAKLKAERDICFEDVQTAIEENEVLDDSQHRNLKRYPNQKMLVVRIRNYAYLVPYVEDNDKIFLKTIIPSRKATKQYLNKGDKL
jgi:uncharacterized DUF497 family protein